MSFYISPCAAELFVSIFIHLKIELLTHIPAANVNNIISEKYASSKLN